MGEYIDYSPTTGINQLFHAAPGGCTFPPFPNLSLATINPLLRKPSNKSLPSTPCGPLLHMAVHFPFKEFGSINAPHPALKSKADCSISSPQLAASQPPSILPFHHRLVYSLDRAPREMSSEGKEPNNETRNLCPKHFSGSSLESSSYLTSLLEGAGQCGKVVIVAKYI